MDRGFRQNILLLKRFWHRVGISEFELLNSNSEILQVFTLK